MGKHKPSNVQLRMISVECGTINQPGAVNQTVVRGNTSPSQDLDCMLKPLTFDTLFTTFVPALGTKTQGSCRTLGSQFRLST
jgi:hypothetical protein